MGKVMCKKHGRVEFNRRSYALYSIIALALGMSIYLLFRDMGKMLFFTWLPKNKYANTIFIQLKPSFFSDFIRFNLPDMLWFISGILFLRCVWFYNHKLQTVYLICFYITGFFFEIIQLSGNVPGTFDYFDLLFLGIGAFVEGLLYKFIEKENWREKWLKNG
jgi:hypothetical protein